MDENNPLVVSKEQEKREYYEEQSHVVDDSALGGLASFNATHGYLEAMVRGFKSGFLTEMEYRQLCNCATLEDVRLTLSDTDLSSVLNGVQNLTPDAVVDAVQRKFTNEFKFLRDSATGQLATFLDMICAEHMISNISFLITSLIRGSDTSALLAKCHPLGMFPRLRTILTFENTADGLAELYRTVLVDTPVAKYYEKYFNAEIRSDEPIGQMQAAYTEVEVDIITNLLQKLWLEDFYRFCRKLGGETWLVMKELLEFEADRRAINIMMNSFGTQLNDQFSRDSERRALFCNFGKLYPEGIESFSKVGDMAQLAAALEPFDTFRRLLQRANNDGIPFSDALFQYEVYLNRFAFDGQSHLAVFWGWVKLNEQQRRNVFWLMSCIFQKRPQKDFQRYIPLW